MTPITDGEPLAKLPIQYDVGGQYFLNADGRMFLQLRGWGYLTGTGGLNLPDSDAAVLQDAIGEHIATCINDHARLVSELETAKRALEYYEKLHTEVYGIGYNIAQAALKSE